MNQSDQSQYSYQNQLPANQFLPYPAPGAAAQGPYTAPPPPPVGYTTGDGPQQTLGAAKTRSRGDGFWKGCCAGLCCCCALEFCCCCF